MTISFFDIALPIALGAIFALHRYSQRVRSNPESFLNLAQDLRLTDHHRIQARRDSKYVPDGFRVAEAVEMLRYGVGRDVMEFAKKLSDQAIVRTFGDDFDAVARRKDNGLTHLPPFNEGSESSPQSVVIEGKPLPDFDRSGFMAESDDCQLHYSNVCRPPK